MDGLAEDIHWAGARRFATCTAALFLAALLVLDAGAGELCVLRCALWAGLAALLFVVLLPPRISVRAGRLSTRGVLVGHSVRTDSLASLQWCDGVAQRLLLRDTDGSSVEIDPTVLTRNPAMWRRLDADTRTSVERGTLLRGSIALRELAEHIDRETAHTVFRVSGLH
ncbi:hypothetical protein ACFWA6_33675 [Streptomyces sp. NPDC060020]|uniref:hypothetical protein n=1 Tax=Streptomyces sp. NPDC060020 TaxID=3347038 RepID=UPI003680DDC3